jgi:hypothetical protein
MFSADGFPSAGAVQNFGRSPRLAPGARAFAEDWDALRVRRAFF